MKLFSFLVISLFVFQLLNAQNAKWYDRGEYIEHGYYFEEIKVAKFSPDSKFIYLIDSKNKVNRLSVESGEVTEIFQLPIELTGVDIHNSGKFVAGITKTSPRHFYYFDIENPDNNTNFEKDYGEVLFFDQDKPKVLIASRWSFGNKYSKDYGSVSIFEPGTELEVKSISGSPYLIDFINNSKICISKNINDEYKDIRGDEATIIDLNDWSSVKYDYRYKSLESSSLALSSSGRYATMYNGQSFDLETNEIIPPSETSVPASENSETKITLDEKFVVVSNEFPESYYVAINTFPFQEQVAKIILPRNQASSIIMSPDGELIAVYGDGRLNIIKPEVWQGKETNLDFFADKSLVDAKESVFFYAHSLSEGTYNWDFGDGTTKTGKSHTHKYSEPGLYTVELVFKSTDGKESKLVKEE